MRTHRDFARSRAGARRAPAGGGTLPPKDELETLRARCWLKRGLVVIEPAEIADDFVRQGLVNEAVRRWGKRVLRRD